MGGQKFLDPGALKRHLKSHAGIKDFVCGSCGKAYGSKRAMDLHISVVHLGEKNFPCKECGKSFGRHTTLRVHMLSHTGERPFQCEFCNAGFKEKRNLQNHIAKSHPNSYTFKEEYSSSEKDERVQQYEDSTPSQEFSYSTPLLLG